MTAAIDLTTDFFALLGLPATQSIDRAALDAAYRELQSRMHPDKFAQASAAEQRQSMQWATRINEAYQTLRLPLTRARYLLELRGHDLAIETNTAMPAEFLMAQMELREALAEAKVSRDETALNALGKQLRTELRAGEAALAQHIDVERDNAAAASQVRQMMFQEKLLKEIDDALDALAEQADSDVGAH